MNPILEIILSTYPNILIDFTGPVDPFIIQDDADGQGIYLAQWNVDLPVPEGLSLGK